MQQLDIKKRIDENNKLIESLMTPNVFTLNNTVAEILAENADCYEGHSYETLARVLTDIDFAIDIIWRARFDEAIEDLMTKSPEKIHLLQFMKM